MVDALPDPAVGPDDVLRLAKLLTQLIGFATHGSTDMTPGVTAAESARKAYAHLPGDHRLDVAEVWTGLALRHHETSAMPGHPDPGGEGDRQRAAAVQAADVVFPIAQHGPHHGVLPVSATVDRPTGRMADAACMEMHHRTRD